VGEADRHAVDRAACVPLVKTPELDFASERLRDYRDDPPLGFLAAQPADDPTPAAAPARQTPSRKANRRHTVADGASGYAPAGPR
jgi:hypothetical protein